MGGRDFSNHSIYRFGFNALETDNEIKGKGKHISFGDYGYNTRLGRRMNVDPIKFEWQSAYACFNGNPLYYADPTGQGAEVKPETDKNNSNKVTGITVTAKFYVYGNNAEQTKNTIQADFEKNIASKSLKGVWGSSRKVPVHFNLTFEVISDEKVSQKETEHQTDPTINLVESTLDKSTTGQYLGNGRFLINLETECERGNTFSHEILHMLGFQYSNNSNENKNMDTHVMWNSPENDLPLMFVLNPKATATECESHLIYSQRKLTQTDIMGIRAKRGLYFDFGKDVKKMIMEYANPESLDNFKNGEKLIR